jgi:hypothetical protein
MKAVIYEKTSVTVLKTAYLSWTEAKRNRLKMLILIIVNVPDQKINAFILS